MSRFEPLMRLTLRVMLFFLLHGCTVVAEPIFDGDGGMDSGSTTLTSRILVADGAGLIGFDFLGQSPPFANAIRWDDVSAAVVGSDVLFLARPGSAAIALYDDATRLQPDRVPTRELNETELGGAIESVELMRIDSNGTLWLLLGEGEVRAFFRATIRLPDGSYSAAVFSDGSLEAFAYDETSDRLFAGPGTARRVLVWEDALTRESVGPSTFELADDCDVSAMAVGRRLFVACGDRRVLVWNDPGGAGAGAPANEDLSSTGVVHDLIVDGGALIGTGPAGVDIWQDAASAAGVPDTHIAIPGERSLRDAAGTLFILDATDVRVVRNAATAPEVMGSVRSERSPLDIAMY